MSARSWSAAWPGAGLRWEGVHLAREHGLQDPVIERLLRAHFSEQRSVFDADNLVALAAEAGLDSYDRETNKGGREEAVPMAAELIPFLRQAVEESHSDLVFPKPDGSMMSEEVNLEDVLRRALARAGVVLGYAHVCRRKGCGHEEQTADATERRCPTHGMRLWPKARHRPIRFHDLRHTTASLLLMAGANPAAVQRILRHSDPRI